jgi:dCTP deaminase
VTELSKIGREKYLLSDSQILERLVETDPNHCIFVSPLIDALNQRGPSSLDLRIGTELKVAERVSRTVLDLRNTESYSEEKSLYYKTIRIPSTGYFVLHPGEFALASTLEWICLPRDIAARLEGRSSLGRLGLLVHATAGFVDPGYEGNLTWELMNAGNLPIVIPPGKRIGQICFYRTEDVQADYPRKNDPKYNRSSGVGFSNIERDQD